MDNIAVLMYFLFAQSKRQYMLWAAFINGLLYIGPVKCTQTNAEVGRLS